MWSLETRQKHPFGRERKRIMVFRRVCANLVACLLFAIVARCPGAEIRSFKSPTSVDGNYHVVHGWPILPENSYLAEVSSVGVDSRGNVFILMRGGRKWP